MTGLRIKESKSGELSLVRSNGIKDGIGDYALSDKLRNLCESICKFQGTADYRNIRIRSGISKSAMSKLENNNLEPSYKLIYRVVKALNELAEFKGKEPF